MDKIHNIDNRLRLKGLRATAQRLMICKAINKAGHIDIETLYEKLKVDIPSLSLATIYKNMHSLVDKEIISEVNIKGKKTMYEINVASHIHHVCTKCGRIEDIDFDISNLLGNIEKLSGKDISEFKLTTYGICSNCL